MAHVTVHDDAIEFDNPILIEGLPGVGLVGKIAVDHLVESLDMAYYAAIRCDGIPPAAVYHGGSPEIRPPVRLHAAPDRDLIVLQSDVPVSPSDAPDFASCLTDWLDESDVMPVYLSGRPADRDEGVPELYGVATGNGGDVLATAGLEPPGERGAVSGPTGALLHQAAETDLDSVGLIVESTPQFPDPEAARVIIDHGIEQIVDIDVGTDDLVDQAEEIQQARQQLAQQMQEGGDESSRAQSLRMYQ